MATKQTCGHCGTSVAAGAPMKSHRKSKLCVTFGLVRYGQVRPPKYILAHKYGGNVRRRVRGGVRIESVVTWYVAPEIYALLTIHGEVRDTLQYLPRYRAIYTEIAVLWWRGALLRVMYRKVKRDREWAASLAALCALSPVTDRDNRRDCFFSFLDGTMWGVLK